MKKLSKKEISISQLEAISGGKVCSIADPSCWIWPTTKRIAGLIKNSPTKPAPKCFPKSASNPAPPVFCP